MHYCPLTGGWHFMDDLLAIAPRRRSNEYLRSLGDTLETLENKSVEYTPTDLNAFNAAPTTCDTFSHMRTLEHKLFNAVNAVIPNANVRVVWCKRDAAHKYVAAVAVFGKDNGVWFDLSPAGLKRRGTLKVQTKPNGRKSYLREDIARVLVDPPLGYHVHIQTLSECLKDCERRVSKRDDMRGLSSAAPHDRNPNRWNLKVCY